MFQGSPIGNNPPRITGATTDTLFIDGLIPSDSGDYQLEYSDSSKGIAPETSPIITVTVVAPGSLPASGIVGLASVLIALGALGALILRRNK